MEQDYGKESDHKSPLHRLHEDSMGGTCTTGSSKSPSQSPAHSASSNGSDTSGTSGGGDEREGGGRERKEEEEVSPPLVGSSSQVPSQEQISAVKKELHDTGLPSTPQQFKRVHKDSESSCARTDLVYVHPPAEEKKLQTTTTKVRKAVCVLSVSILLQPRIHTWDVHVCACVVDHFLLLSSLSSSLPPSLSPPSPHPLISSSHTGVPSAEPS